MDAKIFPVNSKTKQPLTKNGFKDASNDKDVISKWERQYPNCGWATPTETVFVIDVDSKSGGLESWKELTDQHGVPNTYTVKTQHNGYHYYFYMPSGTVVKNSTSKFAQGVDVRGSGGYVVIPETDGYVVENDAPILYPSDWILEKLGVYRPRTGMKSRPATKGFELPKRIENGTRNDTLHRLASSLRAKGLSDETIRLAVHAENKRMSEPLNEDEVDALIESAFRYPNGQSFSTAEDAFTLTDVGNARRFVANYGGMVRYCPSLDWMIWNGKFWEKDELNRVRIFAMNTVYKIYGEAEKAQSKQIAQWASTSQSGSHIDTMLKNAKALLAIDMNEFDKTPDTNFLLNLRNGVLNLQTGELLPHDSELFLTRYVDVEYDPTAKCPKWEAFMERILPEVEKSLFVQKAAGYSLTGSVDAQAWFFCYGIGANGKTTFLEALSGLLGSTLTQQVPIEALMDNGKGQGATPYTVGMFRQRMVFSTEIPMNGRLNDGVMKIISGEKKVVGRNLYKAPFEFDFTAKLWISGNNKPEVNDKSDGFWRKVKLVGFEEVIPIEERRPMTELLAEFKEEHSGILNWLMDGCKLWMQDGLIEPESVRRDTLEYRSEEDILQQFIDDECELGNMLEVEPKTLLKRLIVYMDGMNDNKPYSATKLSRDLAHKGIKRKSKNGKYVGITVKEREKHFN